MKGQQKASPPPYQRAWRAAARALSQYLAQPQKADPLLEHAAEEGGDHANWLLRGCLRWHGALANVVTSRVRRTPHPGVLAALHLGLFELWSRPEDVAGIVHFVVNEVRRAHGQGASRLVNGVLRGIGRSSRGHHFPAPENAHPSWLMDRWQKEFGAGSRQLAIWNQEVASVYVALAPGTAVPDHPGLSVTPWPRTYRVTGGGARDALRPLLESGVAYLTDPSTRHPVELAAPSAGERVLDLCAAPGGKTWRLAHAVGPRGAVVAVDLPGSRLHRLRANADRHPCKNISVYAADVQDLSSLALPKFPLVLLDAPCSNTGVLQRRPDAKWRLEPADFSRLPQLQLSLLQAAAHKLALNGRLIYSTCSIESVENAGVVQAFLAQHREFRLTGIRLSYPWRAHHDGGAAFQLTRLALPPCVGA